MGIELSALTDPDPTPRSQFRLTSRVCNIGRNVRFARRRYYL